MDSKERKLGYWTFVWIYSRRSWSSHFSLPVGHGNIRDNDNRVFRLCFALDAFISRTTRALAKKRNHAYSKFRTKTWHNRVTKIQMSHRRKRKINSKTVRKMMSWAHARFRNRLLSKAEEFGKLVITSVSEAYTSLCGHCLMGLSYVT